MGILQNKNHLTAFALVLLAAIFAASAQAATVTYGLVRTSALTNVNDAEGRWQFDGGEVYLGSTHVGYFVRKKRFSFALSSLNKAALEMTVIWGSGSHNFTVQGEHSFSTGNQVGGVSATSSGFSSFQDATFSGNSSSITITY